MFRRRKRLGLAKLYTCMILTWLCRVVDHLETRMTMNRSMGFHETSNVLDRARKVSGLKEFEA